MEWLGEDLLQRQHRSLLSSPIHDDPEVLQSPAAVVLGGVRVRCPPQVAGRQVRPGNVVRAERRQRRAIQRRYGRRLAPEASAQRQMRELCRVLESRQPVAANSRAKPTGVSQSATPQAPQRSWLPAAVHRRRVCRLASSTTCVGGIDGGPPWGHRLVVGAAVGRPRIPLTADFRHYIPRMRLLGNDRPQPHEVFTPGSIPLEEHNVYVRRAEAEANLERFLQRRQVPVIFGEYGVGKTTVVQRFFQDRGVNGRLVYVPSVSGLALPDIFQVVLEHLGFRVEIERTAGLSKGVDGGFDLKVVKANAKGEESNSSTHQLVVSSPTDVGVIKAIRNAGLVIVLDEMHKASDSFRGDLVDFIKASRTGGGGFDLVLIGTSPAVAVAV